MSYDNNPYTTPENWALTTIAEFDRSDGFYQFDYVVVWKDHLGNLFYASDSGCSCPVPFEDTKVSDLTRINPLNIGGDLRSAIGEYLEHSGRSRAEWEQQVNDLIHKATHA